MKKKSLERSAPDPWEWLKWVWEGVPASAPYTPVPSLLSFINSRITAFNKNQDKREAETAKR